MSVYYTATTLCTVGYGDITPKNILEVIYSASIIVMGSGIFAFNISRLGSFYF